VCCRRAFISGHCVEFCRRAFSTGHCVELGAVEGPIDKILVTVLSAVEGPLILVTALSGVL
jgi:hypothetical protein